MTREEMLGLHASTTLDSEKARLEAEIWKTVPSSERVSSIGPWFASNTQFKSGEVQNRHILWNSGALGALFLKECDSGLSVYTAVNLLRKTKARVVPGGQASDSLVVAALVLTEYQASGNVIVHGEKMFVRSKPSERHSTRPARPGPKTFWRKVRTMCDNFLHEKIADIPASEAEAIRTEFEVDLQLVFNDLQRRINRARNDSEGRALDQARASRVEVREACAVLGVDPPLENGEVDIVAARRNYRKLARVYHPDMNGGDQSKLPNYNSVVAAYKVVGDWNSRKACPK